MSVSIRAHPGRGIKRSEEVPADVSITNKIGRKLLVMMALVAGAAGSLLVWQIVRRSPAAGKRDAGYIDQYGRCSIEEHCWASGCQPERRQTDVFR